MIWQILGILFLAGGIGGTINALMSDNGFVVPKPEDANGIKIWRPGVLGNVFIGAVAAVIWWGLYGPFANFVFVNYTGTTNQPEPSLTLSTLAGAVLTGVAGARWLSNEVDKKLLKATTAGALAGVGSIDTAAKVMAASPAQALKIVQSMNR